MYIYTKRNEPTETMPIQKRIAGMVDKRANKIILFEETLKQINEERMKKELMLEI